HRKLSGLQLHGCLRHRGAGQYRDRSRGRQCGLQRDRNSHAGAADDAGRDLARARTHSSQELTQMNSFEWIDAGTVSGAVGAATATVAEAMRSRTGEPPSDQAVVVEAGGVDLVDLMKEGLLTPRRLVNLRGVAELSGIAQDQDGALRIGAMATLAQIGEHPLVRARYVALADAAASSASPQIRQVATLGGNLLQRPRCWYFRSAQHHCARKGGETCFAFAGENQYHAIFDHRGCAIVHPSTAATALVALGTRIE